MVPERPSRIRRDRSDSAYQSFGSSEIDGAGPSEPSDGRPALNLDAERRPLSDRSLGPSTAHRIEEVVVEVDDAYGYAEDDGKVECGFSIGWYLFVCGFICVFPWALGGVLPWLSSNVNDRRAAYFNTAAFLIAAIVFMLVVVAYS